MHTRIQPHLGEAVAARFAVWRPPHRRPGFQPGNLGFQGHAVIRTRTIGLTELMSIGGQNIEPPGCDAATPHTPAASYENTHSASFTDGRR